MSDGFYAEKDWKSDFKILAGMWIYIALVIVIGFFSLVALRAGEESVNWTKFFMFPIILLAYGIYTTTVKVMHRYGHGKGWVAFLHDPEKSPLSKVPFIGGIIKNPFKLIVVSYVFFFAFAFVSSLVPQDSLIGSYAFPVLPAKISEQVSPVGELTFAYYSSPAENGWLWIVLALVMGGVLWGAGKLNVAKKWAYGAFFVPICLLSAFIWMAIHNLVTGGEIFQFSHWIFGFNLAFLTLITGSVIPAQAYHDSNNLFMAVKTLFGHEIISWVFGLLLVVAGVVLVYYLASVEKDSGS